MRFEYFVSFAHSKGFGNQQIFSRKLLKFADLKDTQKIIEGNGSESVVVIHYRLIGFSLFKSIE